MLSGFSTRQATFFICTRRYIRTRRFEDILQIIANESDLNFHHQIRRLRQFSFYSARKKWKYWSRFAHLYETEYHLWDKCAFSCIYIDEIIFLLNRNHLLTLNYAINYSQVDICHIFIISYSNFFDCLFISIPPLSSRMKDVITCDHCL